MTIDYKILFSSYCNVQYKPKYLQSQVGFILEIQGWVNTPHKPINIINYINGLEANHIIISADTKSVFDQIQHDFLINILNIVGLEIIYFMIIKATYEGYITNIILYRKNIRNLSCCFFQPFLLAHLHFVFTSADP